MAAAALVAAGAVLAADPGKEKIARTAAGNAQARSEVLRRADLGKGWSGGFKKPSLSSTEPCSYRPKQSDLVLVGAAETTWSRPLAREVESEAQILRTPAMVRRDWRRTVTAPQVLPCLRQGFKKVLGPQVKALSVRRVAFPRVATYTRAFRLRARVESEAGAVPIEIDVVVLGGGRSEITLTLSAIGSGRGALQADALRLARVLAHRVR
ncbi:MAG TPA: hypothetical protein VJV76_00770 [Gaiellaceae bacterium]|nr:hypothetical protein [Gaiellaceae bacterium]